MMMSTITIHTENENQINLLKALLKELKINFEIDKEENLTEWQKKQLIRGIDEADKGDFVSKEDAKEILDQCFR
jgi:predicted transcriptional regulator